jgi:hypothetical protein
MSIGPMRIKYYLPGVIFRGSEDDRDLDLFEKSGPKNPIKLNGLDSCGRKNRKSI